METLKECKEKLETAKDVTQISNEIVRFCGINNLSLAVTDERLSTLYTIANGTEGKMLPREDLWLLFQEAGDKIICRRSILSSRRLRICFPKLCIWKCWGQLDNKNYSIVQTPMESIPTAQQSPASFYLYVELGMALGGSQFLAWLVTGRMSETAAGADKAYSPGKWQNLILIPIIPGGGKDEIGVLGCNFNRMSEQLEHNNLRTQDGEQSAAEGHPAEDRD